jgi:predicted AlkP superfamily pyrophosphatase or phosphodiesterase
MKFATLLLALVFGLAGGVGAHASPPPKDPRLVVAISVDQYAWSLFQRYRPTYTGGFRRLADGRVFLGYQSHASTETCPGHSTLLTGDHPSRTGIVANTWYDRQTGSSVYCVSVAGVADPRAKSAANLKVDTLGDWLRARHPEARVISISGKDRAAIMMAGHRPTGVFWWDDGLGFGTSKFAGPADTATLAPVTAFNRRLFAAWDTAPPELWPQTLPERCAPLVAAHTFGRLALSGAVPPETAKGATQGVRWRTGAAFTPELRASPLMDRLTLEMAAELVEARGLGRRAQPDLLAISLSGTDHIGHRYGSGGAEMCVQQASLDAALGAFFAKLDALGVPYVVALAADHGGIDAAERRGPPARRIDTAKVVAGLNAELRAKFGFAYDAINGDDANQLILSLPPEDNKRRAEVMAAAVAWLKAQPEVAEVFTAAEVAALAPPRGKPPGELSIIERFAESFDAPRSGDILVNFAQFATLGMPSQPGQNVAGHGSAWDYDRQVPILFWWPGVAPAEAGPIETVDIAPTLAPFLHLAAPDVDGRCVELGQGCR